MIPQKQIQRAVISELEDYVGCAFVPSNTTKKKPTYPYGTFTVINTSEKKGTYSEATVDRDGEQVPVLVMPVLQKWSFTIQSDDDAEAMEKALMVSDFFTEAKRQELADKGIIVADVGAITPRDNLLTIEYEYRKGLDVTLRLNNVIDKPDNGAIEKVTLTSDTVGEINVEKE